MLVDISNLFIHSSDPTSCFATEYDGWVFNGPSFMDLKSVLYNFVYIVQFYQRRFGKNINNFKIKNE